MQHDLGSLGGQFPVLDPTLEHSATTSAHQQSPASVSAGDLHRAGSKIERTRLSSAHGPSLARPGGQGQLHFKRTLSCQFCKPVQPVHSSDLRERWPRAFQGFPLLQ